MFLSTERLNNLGVLGINRRNADYTLRYNKRHLYPLVDDKLHTKQLAEKAGMAVPKLYGVVKFYHQIRDLSDLLQPYSDFVLKPAHGSEGDGIFVLTGRTKNMFRTADDLLMTQEELEYYVSNILSGMYSLGGHPDKALIEYRVEFDPVFEGITYRGVPDIRIIVFLGIPVMAMVRLPTHFSKGKANLHQGAIGVGIEISSGTTLTAVWHNNIVNEHPDTGNQVSDLIIPGWESLLLLAARCYELTGLGYQGIDIVLDKDQGPLILEINARPGLNIQLANYNGLLPRLKLIKEHYRKLNNVEERVAFAKDNFAA
ncbi:MAG: alpha-L-glutamate ligase-like protein [Pseudomonadota bacterium]